MTKKFVVKTTKEFTYDKDGYITKEVVTEESYEEEINKNGVEINKNGVVAKGQIRVDDFAKAKGVPYTSTFDNCDPSFLVKGNGDVTVAGDLKVNSKSVSDFANEVKAILEKEISKAKRISRQ